jgi:hypothetical protein
MPLTRFPDVHEVENLVGVRFLMQDVFDPAKKVTCLVTIAAMEDRASFEGHDDDRMRAWREHRGTIEALASANYDQQRFNARGEVLVDEDELTPIDWRPVLFRKRESRWQILQKEANFAPASRSEGAGSAAVIIHPHSCNLRRPILHCSHAFAISASYPLAFG